MVTNRYMQPTIELCTKCKGEGVTWEYPDWDKLGHTEATPRTCTTCEGSGRVVVSKKIEVTVIPFKNKT